MPTAEPYLSVTIPAYNEESRLPTSLRQLKEFLSHEPWSCEVVVVDDGSVDRTAEVVREWMREWPDLRLVEGPHRGKGGAVRAGILAATGRYVALADADFAMPVAEFRRFFPVLDEGHPIVIGSREAAGAKRFDEPMYRHVMGRVFNNLVRVLLLQGITDTQCGFKVLRREVAALLCEQQTLNGWGFDVELLVIARLCGYPVAEVGIPWYYMPGSRVNPVRDTITMFADILRIRRNLWRRVYRAPSSVADHDEALVVPVRQTPGE